MNMDYISGMSQNLQAFATPSSNPIETGGVHEAEFLRESLVAALEEMKVWVLLMSEHAKFIRLGLDPNPNQEEFFRIADQFSVQLESLHREVIQTPSNAPVEILFQLRERTIVMVNHLIQFKRTLFQLLEECKALAILPAILVDHIRREADRFVGTLERSKGKVTRNRQTLGIPDGQIPAETVPRLLYHRLSPAQLFKVGVEEVEFFSRIHSEHAEHLSMSFRPEVQENYRKTALFYKQEFANQIEQAKMVEQSGSGFEALASNGIKISTDFNNYLRRVLYDITTCTIPTKQTNFPPLLADHMSRETVYYMDILQRLTVR
ncbi:DUF2935 domain-containing protein [Paenibacillus harenae]|uniref:DUF2935 domain-containing protein n=1 Tax=Paenibacillus harenae TaxID=306543 RepID=UPI0003FCA7B2|nr:DUF2935 domain-containing protein [Paenibacillus harenae]